MRLCLSPRPPNQSLQPGAVTWLSQSPTRRDDTVLKRCESSAARGAVDVYCNVITIDSQRVPSQMDSSAWEGYGSSRDSLISCWWCHDGLGWATARSTACNRCGCRLHDAVRQSQQGTAIAAVPAKACLQTRWDSDLISPPVPILQPPAIFASVPGLAQVLPSTPLPLLPSRPPTCASHPHAIQSLLGRRTNPRHPLSPTLGLIVASARSHPLLPDTAHL
jgi:hypothetical protein